MAWTRVGSVGTGFSKTSGTTLLFVVTATVEVGNVIVLAVASDNITTTDGNTSDHASVIDSQGNTWVKAREFTNGQGGAGSGATVSVWTCKVTTQLTASTDTITVNFALAVTAKADSATEYTIGAGNTVSVEAGLDEAADGVDPGTLTLSGLDNIEHLFVRAQAHEGPNGDTFSQDTSYTLEAQQGTTGGAAASNMTVGWETRILTGTGDSSGAAFNWTTARDDAGVYVALKEAGGGGGGPTHKGLHLLGVGH